MDFDITMVPVNDLSKRAGKEKYKRSGKVLSCVFDIRDDKIVIVSTDIVRELYYKDIKTIRPRERYKYVLVLELWNRELYLLSTAKSNQHPWEQSITAAVSDLQHWNASRKRIDMVYNLIKSKME